MNIDFVERLIGLVERFRVTELDYAEGGTKVRISRHAGATPPSEAQREDAASIRSALASAQPDDVSAEVSKTSEHLLAAGMLGTFYRSPGPGQAPFVSEGDAVEDGQTLGILEAMKTLNPVEADRAGRILRILVEDGASVAAGKPLFAIDLAD